MEREAYEQAIADFASCLDDATYGPSSIYNTGVCYMRMENYEMALDFLSRVQDQDFDGVNYNVGVCSMLLDKIEEAVAVFTASYEKESYTTDALYNRAICYVSLEDFADAIADFTAYLDGVKALQIASMSEDAVEPVNPEDVPDAVDIATYSRGVCYLSIGGNEAAIADFTACIENDLAVIDSRFNRGLACLQAGDSEQANEDFTECLNNDYNTDAALFYRSYALFGMGDPDGAIADLTACIENGYNLGQAYYQRAHVYLALGDENNYIADLENSLAY